MMRKIVVGVAAWIVGIGFAFATQVDVNKADAAMLDAVKGLGPAKSKAILEERTRNGDFKDWGDLQQRVKGIGDKAAMRLSSAGLVVNGKAMEGAPASTVKAKGKEKEAAPAQ